MNLQDKDTKSINHNIDMWNIEQRIYVKSDRK